MPPRRTPAGRDALRSPGVPFALELALLAAVGLVAGALNVVAGGGSFLTLPVLLFLGLPAAVANGTNRVGVLARTSAASGGITGTAPWTGASRCGPAGPP